VRQGETITRQLGQMRELTHERGAALSREVAAYDLAEQYARQSGVQVERDAVLRYVQEYWDRHEGFHSRMTSLEDMHWEMFRLVADLDRGEKCGQLGALGSVDLAHHIAARIRAASPNTTGGRAVDLFPRPAAPKSTSRTRGGAKHPTAPGGDRDTTKGGHDDGTPR
jgi:hypothetical protein